MRDDRKSKGAFRTGRGILAAIIVAGLAILIDLRRDLRPPAAKSISVVGGRATERMTVAAGKAVERGHAPATAGGVGGGSDYFAAEMAAARREFEREPRDEDWARRREAGLTDELRRLTATEPGLQHATVRCASARCEVSARTLDEKPPPSGARLMNPGDWTDEIRTEGMAVDAMFVTGEPARGQDVTLYLTRR